MQNHEEPTLSFPFSPLRFGILFLFSFLLPIAPEPGVACKDKNEKNTQKRRLQSYGTFTARNVIREQHELGEEVYDTVGNVSGICFFLSALCRAPRARKKKEEKRRKQTANVRHIDCTQRHTRAA
jgi:hypothetical protein